MKMALLSEPGSHIASPQVRRDRRLFPQTKILRDILMRHKCICPSIAPSPMGGLLGIDDG